jgi:hypothetical protein
MYGNVRHLKNRVQGFEGSRVPGFQGSSKFFIEKEYCETKGLKNGRIQTD